MNTQTYDLIIIGAGSGGLNVAGFFSRLSLSVLIIDKSPEHIGGDCLNTGCVPSKALIHVARKVHEAREAGAFFGEGHDMGRVDMAKVRAHITRSQAYIREHENPEYLKNKGIDFKSGAATFVGGRTILLNGVHYSAKHIVLATGSRPRMLTCSKDGSVPVYSNETIFQIQTIPEHFVFVGGGPISCELGQAFARLGSRVTILHTGSRILEKEPEFASALLAESFDREHITIVYNARIEKISGGQVWYTISRTPGKESESGSKQGNELHSVQADAVFAGIGRELNIDGMQLDMAGVEVDQTGSKLVMDASLRTTSPHIYAVGDVAGNYQFTHAAEMHARVVIQNMLSPLRSVFNSEYISWVTYTDPQVATFGISEQEAVARGCTRLTKDFSRDDRAIVDDEKNGMLALYIDKAGHIKGGTMVAPDAGEMFQELVLAMSAEIKVGAIFNKTYPYPTKSRINKSIIADYMQAKLTPRLIRVLRFLYRNT